MRFAVLLVSSLGALAVASSYGACFSKPQPACNFVCGGGGTCPTDYACADDGYCHLVQADGSLASCTLPKLDAADAPPLDAVPDAMVDAMPDAMVDAMPDAMVDAMVDAAPALIILPSCPAMVDVTITAPADAYVPPTATIPLNGVVKFEMPAFHDAISDASLFSVGFNATTCIQFVQTGTYGFTCSVHAFSGQVTVQ